MAARAAARIGSGTAKCGWPMERLIGSFKLRASSKTRRTPESSMPRARSAIQRSIMSPLKDFVRAASGLRQALGDPVEIALHLGHRLGPLMRIERQAAMDQINQVFRRGGIADVDRF